MSLAYRNTVGGDDVLEDLPRAGIADVGEDAGQPVGVFLLDADLPFPFRIRKVLPRLRQVLLLDLLRVVRLHEDVEPRAHPFAVRKDRGRDQVREVRALDELQDILAMHRFELGPVGLHDVDGETVRARFLHRSLNDVLGTGAPRNHLHAVLLLERGAKLADVGRLERRVDAEGAFLLRARDQLLHAVGAGVERDIGGSRARLHLRGDDDARRGDEREGNQDFSHRETVCGSRAGRSASSAEYASSMRDARPRVASASVNHWRILGDSSA